VRQLASQSGINIGDSADLAASLRDLFKQMSLTQEGFPPLMFLQALRSNFPQFQQRAKDGRGYAQQDAEEAWSQIISTLRQKLKTKEKVDGEEKEIAWVDKYMAGKFESVLKCDEEAATEAGEESVESKEEFFKLDCHMSAETNHLAEGLRSGLIEKLEKKSPVLDRDAVYTKTSRIARLPKYLTVHFMRFDWRKTTNKKAKILRKVTFQKVTFQSEIDAVEFCTDDLKKRLIPIRDKIREIRKEDEDVERAKKRQKRLRDGEENDVQKGKGKGKANADTKGETGKSGPAGGKSGDTEMEDIVYKTDAEIDAEHAASIKAAKEELLKLVNQELAADTGANQTGLYELRGIITHQGASADSGHYTAFIRQEGTKDPTTGKRKEEDGSWWWFNDDKVSLVEPERVEQLSGGGKPSKQLAAHSPSIRSAYVNNTTGQSHSALILLYRAVPLPTV
jgi:ubiquitin carboxyl-terminal hydrolase 14